MLKNFEEYSSSTGLHGIQYLGDNSRLLFERIWWFIMIMLSMIVCGYFIYQIWSKWNDSPIIETFAPASTPIWQIPFPAVTVCSTSRVRPRILNITEIRHKYKNLEWNDFNETEKLKLQALSHICNFIKAEKRNFTDSSLTEYLRSLSQATKVCTVIWDRNLEGYCDDFMNPVTTDRGFCQTFNGLDPTEIFRENAVQYNESIIINRKISNGWSSEIKYDVDLTSNDTYPRHSSSTDSNSGLILSLIINKDDIDYVCSGFGHGFRIKLHSAADLPSMGQEYFIAPMSEQSLVTIKPSMVTTSPTLRKYDPEIRKCLFPDEKILKYFKIYTLQNCQWECISNFTFNFCGCVAYWMPRDSWMQICDYGKFGCMKKAKTELKNNEIKYAYSKSVGDTENAKIFENALNGCKCMPDCNEISYDTEITHSRRDSQEYSKTKGVPSYDPNSMFMVRVKVFFKKHYFRTTIKSELYGVIDFFANCGGILGLFMGFSILSLVEIFYFISIRPVCAKSNKISSNNKNQNIEKLN